VILLRLREELIKRYFFASESHYSFFTKTIQAVRRYLLPRAGSIIRLVGSIIRLVGSIILIEPTIFSPNIKLLVQSTRLNQEEFLTKHP
jgi:hypothetical protein